MSEDKIHNFNRIITGLHTNWEPHQGQVKIGRALFQDNVKDILVCAGRNFGKTELLIYCLWRWAEFNPGSECYYFSPYFKQSKEILWASQRMQTFGPKEWIDSSNNTELRMTFKNKSFIKLDGSDNVEAYRGVKPKGLIVFDEFKDFRPEFFDAFDPNRSAHLAPLVIIGTPPDRECQFTKLMDEYQLSSIKKYFHAPSWENTYLNKDSLKQKKAELYAKGEGDVWEREYAARFIKGGASKIFPMLSRKHTKPRAEILQTIKRDIRKMQWILFADPAAASCFAVLYVGINTFNKQIYVLDELYETDQSKMSVRQIAGPINIKAFDIQDRKEWRKGYDEAETWFANEMHDIFGETWEPSHKAQNDKEVGLSLIKDILMEEKITIASECEKFYWELDNYYKDRNGKIPKKDDHLIDCFRYILGAEFYTLNKEDEKIETDDPMFRGATIQQELPELLAFDNTWGDYEST